MKRTHAPARIEIDSALRVSVTTGGVTASATLTPSTARDVSSALAEFAARAEQQQPPTYPGRERRYRR